MKPKKNHTILYMDDDPDDLEMLQEAIEKLDDKFHMVEAMNGHQGLSTLKKMKASGDLPCLIVLDINMPLMNGRETFQHIKSDEALSSIPIVIFSTSASERDKSLFKVEKVEYITKPINFSHLVKVAEKLLDYCKN